MIEAIAARVERPAKSVTKDIVFRLASSSVAPSLPAVENSAGKRFETSSDFSWVAEGKDRSADQYFEFINQGLSWVAVTRAGRCIAFLCGEAQDGELHICELAVRREYQGMGIGRRLAELAAAQAVERGLSAVTLTTFIRVAWNAPYYVRLGFNIVEPKDMSMRLRSLMEAEAEQGLALHDRCAMRLDLSELHVDRAPQPQDNPDARMD